MISSSGKCRGPLAGRPVMGAVNTVLRRVRPVLLLLPAVVQSANAAEAPAGFHDAYLQCREENDEIMRLRCYDALGQSVTRSAAEVEEAAGSEVGPPQDYEERERIKRIDRLAALSRRQERGMVTADEPSYFAYVTPFRNDSGDDDHIEFYLSLKYPVFDDWLSDLQSYFGGLDSNTGKSLRGLTPDRMLLHYNGLYDFYASSSEPYDSAPIVSRRQNPGLSVEYTFAGGRDTLRLAWFHESNGQQLEEDDSARFQELRDLYGDDYALSKVSRGWDYAQIRWSSNSLGFDDPLSSDWFNYQAELRFYCNCQGFGFIDGREDDIWWEESNSDVIGDFDGLRVAVDGSLPDAGPLSLDARLELQTGLEHSFGQYVTGRLTLGAKWDNIRLTLFYFDGYGRDPSTYNVRTRYGGIGFALN